MSNRNERPQFSAAKSRAAFLGTRILSSILGFAASACIYIPNPGSAQSPLAIQCPTDAVVSCADSWAFEKPTVTGACGDGQITLRIIDTTTNAVSDNARAITRIWEAEDPCGNTARCGQNILVVDDAESSLQATLDSDSAGQGKVVLSWPVTCREYGLETASSLETPITWSPVEAPFSVEGGMRIVRLSGVQGTAFYRLRAPGSPYLRQRFAPPKPWRVAIQPDRSVAGVFIMKFVEGSHVRLGTNGLTIDDKAIQTSAEEQRRLARAGGLNAETAAGELQEIAALLESYRASHAFDFTFAFRPPGFAYDPDEPSADDPFREKGELEQRAGEELADLDLYYVVYAKNFSELEVQRTLMDKLNRYRLIEQVYTVAPSDGAACDTPDLPTPLLESRQGYLNAAPQGIDARYAWGVPGGGGSAARLIDVEYDWVTDHEDFPPASQLFWGGRPTCAYDGRQSEHGTATLGVIAAPHDSRGIHGIAPGVLYGLSSVCRPFDYAWAAIVATFSGEQWVGRAHNVVVANAIRLAATGLVPGNILLIEQHTFGPATGISCPSASNPNCGQWEWVAMEYYQECFDVIRQAVARGITVVEAAGNGSQNLDGPVYGARFNPAVRHSGALLIGASGQGDNRPAVFSNTSRRVDLHSWGSGVVTTGYGDEPSSPFPFNNTRPICRRYTGGYGGTSSASAIVAGGVASLQSAQFTAGRLPLAPQQVRTVLRNTGTAQVPDARLIGPQPNLRAAIESLGRSSGGFSGEGYYTIRARHSRKVLDIDIDWFRGQDNGQRLLQYESHGGSNQRFEIRWAGRDAVGRNEWSFFPRHVTLRNKALDIAGWSSADGAAVQQWNWHGGANQRFRIEPVGGIYYRIVSVHSGKALDVAGASLDNRAPVVQWPWHGGENQQFEFLP